MRKCLSPDMKLMQGEKKNYIPVCVDLHFLSLTSSKKKTPDKGNHDNIHVNLKSYPLLKYTGPCLIHMPLPTKPSV